MFLLVQYRLYFVLAPAGIGTDVVDEWAAFQDGLHFSQRHIFSSLKLHQVFLTVLIHTHTHTHANIKQISSDMISELQEVLLSLPFGVYPAFFEFLSLPLWKYVDSEMCHLQEEQD